MKEQTNLSTVNEFNHQSKLQDLQAHFREWNLLGLEQAMNHYKQCFPVPRKWLSVYYNAICNLLYLINPEEYVRYLELLQPLYVHIKHKSSSDSIYHCCIPKTGSQWVRQILSDVRVFEYSGLNSFPVERFYDTQGTFFPAGTITNGTFCMMFDDYMSLKKPEKYKTFFVKRDPRDYVISNYFSTRFSHALIGDIPHLRNILENLSIEDGILEIIEDNKKKKLFEIMRSWINADQVDPNVLIVKFEDLTGCNQVEVFEKIFDHCDIKMPYHILSQLLREYSFETMTNGRKQGESDQKSHYRKGVPGDWKNYFTDKIEKKFYEVTENLVRDLGY